MKNYTKQDLIREVEAAVGLELSDAERLVQATLDAIAEGLRSEDVTVYHFGNFSKRQRRARIARNPRTGETGIAVPEKTIVFFVPSKDLVEMISGELT